MRITIKFDSADTDAVRALCVALHRVGLTATLKVGVNGPSAWCGETPPLTPNQYASVFAHLVKFHGSTIAALLDSNDNPDQTHA
jgi:hypothetical protein